MSKFSKEHLTIDLSKIQHDSHKQHNSSHIQPDTAMRHQENFFTPKHAAQTPRSAHHFEKFLEQTQQEIKEQKFEEVCMTFQKYGCLPTDEQIKIAVPVLMNVEFFKQQCPNKDLKSLTEFTDKICRSLKYEIVKPGTAIFHHGDVGQKFYIILKGECKIYVPKTDEEMHQTQEYKHHLSNIILRQVEKIVITDGSPNNGSGIQNLIHHHHHQPPAEVNTPRSQWLNKNQGGVLQQFLHNGVMMDENDYLLANIGQEAKYFDKLNRSRFQCVNSLLAGSYFGELALTLSQPRGATIVSRDEVHLVELTKTDFNKIFSSMFHTLIAKFEHFKMFFSQLREKQIKNFIYPWQDLSVHRNIVLWRENDVPNQILFVKSGMIAFEKYIEIQESYNPDTEVQKINEINLLKPTSNKIGHVQILATFGPGEFIGQEHLLPEYENKNRLYQVQTLIESQFYFISYEEYQTFRRTQEQPQKVIKQKTMSKLQWLDERIETQKEVIEDLRNLNINIESLDPNYERRTVSSIQRAYQRLNPQKASYPDEDNNLVDKNTSINGKPFKLGIEQQIPKPIMHKKTYSVQQIESHGNDLLKNSYMEKSSSVIKGRNITPGSINNQGGDEANSIKNIRNQKIFKKNVKFENQGMGESIQTQMNTEGFFITNEELGIATNIPISIEFEDVSYEIEQKNNIGVGDTNDDDQIGTHKKKQIYVQKQTLPAVRSQVSKYVPMHVITELMDNNQEHLIEQSNVREQMREQITKPMFQSDDIEKSQRVIFRNMTAKQFIEQGPPIIVKLQNVMAMKIEQQNMQSRRRSKNFEGMMIRSDSEQNNFNQSSIVDNINGYQSPRISFENMMYSSMNFTMGNLQKGKISQFPGENPTICSSPHTQIQTSTYEKTKDIELSAGSFNPPNSRMSTLNSPRSLNTPKASVHAGSSTQREPGSINQFSIHDNKSIYSPRSFQNNHISKPTTSYSGSRAQLSTLHQEPFTNNETRKSFVFNFINQSDIKKPTKQELDIHKRRSIQFSNSKSPSNKFSVTQKISI